MYLHLGQEKVIKTEDIIGIFDLDTTTVSSKTRKFLNKAEKKGQVSVVSYELPKSFILCKANGEQKIYLSQISPTTLLKRSGFLKNL